MYTNLHHEQIINAIIWLYQKAKKMHIKKGKRTRSKDDFTIISKFNNSIDGRKKSIRWSSTRSIDKDELTFTFDDILMIVTIDLSYSYQSRGKDIFLQTHGCPIGGFLSAIYANVKCAHDEFSFLTNIGPLRERVYGIRQMDDLFLCVAYKNSDLISKTQAFKLKKTILDFNSTYKGGLELEEQEFTIINNYTSEHNFAGTTITVTQNPQQSFSIACRPLNKNIESVLSLKVQAFPRFIPAKSMVPKHYKQGMQITSFLRMCDQSSSANILVSSMVDNFKEMTVAGYSIDLFSRSLLSLSQKNIFWAPITKMFFSRLIKEDLSTYKISVHPDFIHIFSNSPDYLRII